MFNNIGKKVKILAWLELVAGIALSILIGIVIILSSQFLIGIITMAIGILISWIATLSLYAIGEIAENTKKMLEKIEDYEQKNLLPKQNTNICKT